MPSFVDVLRAVDEAWTERRDGLIRRSEEITKVLGERVAPASAIPSSGVLGEAVDAIGGMAEIILRLQTYWAGQGCAILQPYDMEVGAGTFHPATFLRAIGPEPWNSAYVQPSRRPTDGRYGENPNRLQHYYQFQVILKPSPLNIQELYIDSLRALGIDLYSISAHKIHGLIGAGALIMAKKTLIEPQLSGGGQEGEGYLISAASQASGAQGSYWQTDVDVNNSGATVLIATHDHTIYRDVDHRLLELRGGQMHQLRDGVMQ